MKCFLHIGSHKTATSSIQEFIYNSIGQNSGYNFVYPKCIIWPYDRSHNLLGIHFWDDIRNDLKIGLETIINALKTEVEGHENIIISSEMMEKVPLSGNMHAFLHFLRVITDLGYEIFVSYVVRRQDFMVDLIFKQWIAGYDTKFCGNAQKMAEYEVPQLFYGKIAEAWSSIPLIKHVTVIPFAERNINKTASALLGSFGLSHLVSDFTQLPTANRSLDGDFLRLKHFINKSQFTRQFNEEYFDAIVNSDILIKDVEKITIFTPLERIRYLSLFEDDLKLLCKRYGFCPFDWESPLFNNLESPSFQ